MSRAPLEILAVKAPVRFVGVTIRSGVVFLPWPKTHIDLYQELAALADREVSVKGDVLEWPRQMMMLGDFHGRE